VSLGNLEFQNLGIGDMESAITPEQVCLNSVILEYFRIPARGILA